MFKMTPVVLAGYIRARDPSRPVHYEGGGSQTPATDIVCPMYARIPQITRLADDLLEHRPVIQCEYAHAMGNGTGNYREYWDAYHNHPHLQVRPHPLSLPSDTLAPPSTWNSSLKLTSLYRKIWFAPSSFPKAAPLCRSALSFA
jgi:hypothetical protein